MLEITYWAEILTESPLLQFVYLYWVEILIESLVAGTLMEISMPNESDTFLLFCVCVCSFSTLAILARCGHENEMCCIMFYSNLLCL